LDQGYREILPIIRLRSESPQWLDTIVLLLLAALVLIPLFLIELAKTGQNIVLIENAE
jgi:hypothetical protein